MTKIGPRKEALRYLTDGIHRTIDSIDCALTDQLVDAIHDAERVFIYGAGRSGFVAQIAASNVNHSVRQSPHRARDKPSAANDRMIHPWRLMKSLSPS